MPETQTWEMRVFGGVNYADQADLLAARAFQDGVGVQIAPVESPDLQNIDFLSRQGLGTRLGSAEFEDLTALLDGGETLLGGKEIVSAATNQVIMLVIGTVHIFTNESGSFAKMKCTGGHGIYNHTAAPTQYSIEVQDGHAFMGFNGLNHIQVYRNGDGLDDQLNANEGETTVDQNSASGQKVLFVADTSIFDVHDGIIINEGGPREENVHVDTIQAGVSLTTHEDLANTHTAGQADTVSVQNLYVEALGGDTHIIDGAWDEGEFLLQAFHGRLVISQGNTQYAYSTIPSSTTGIWKRSAWAAARDSRGRIISLDSFSPEFKDELTEYLYVFTTEGPQVLTDLTATSDVHNVTNGGVPVNHHCVLHSPYALLYLTEDKRIEGIQGAKVLPNLGRRLTSPAKDGPLDKLDQGNAGAIATGLYLKDKSQACWWYPQTSSATNTHTLILDLKLDEFGQLTEQVVRPLSWKGQDFVSVFTRRRGGTIGVRSGGILHTLESGRLDFGSATIEDYWFLPIFRAAAPDLHKQYLRLLSRLENSGDWEIPCDVFIDGSLEVSKTINLKAGESQSVYDTAVYDTAVYTTTTVVRDAEDIDRYNEAIQFKLRNAVASQYWAVSAMALKYEFGTEEI